MDKINEAYYATPIDIKVSDSKSFVKYIKDEDLNSLIQEYAVLEGRQDLKSYLVAVKDAQKQATISTTVRYVLLTYREGRTQDITLVVKTIDYVDEENKPFILEFIPKDVISSSDDIVIITKHEIIKKDPIIKFEAPNSIAYYVEGKKNLSDFESVETIILPDDLIITKNKITGYAITDVQMDGTKSLIIIVILLVLVYIFYSVDVFKKLKLILFISIKGKKFHSMKMLANDALDSIEAGEFENAYLIYREIKLYYDRLSNLAKNELYDSLIEICQKLDARYAIDLVQLINHKLDQNLKNEAQSLYHKLQATYKKLNDENKTLIYKEIELISSKLEL